MPVVAENLPNVCDALNQGIVRHCGVVPDVLEQLFLLDYALSLVEQIQKNFEGLLSKVLLASCSGDATARGINLYVIEPIDWIAWRAHISNFHSVVISEQFHFSFTTSAVAQYENRYENRNDPGRVGADARRDGRILSPPSELEKPRSSRQVAPKTAPIA